MRLDRLPLTYAESRARLLRAATDSGAPVDSWPIAARGPDGAELSVDTVRVGPHRPRRALLVLSGVHGVEGFIGSALQCDLLERLDPPRGPGLPPDTAVVLVHAVNPWGMAWWRRQNESNVDLNRNWARSDSAPAHNDAYDRIHALACPDTEGIPTLDQLMVEALALVERHGEPWLRDAITRGQYRHPDGLHFGGERTEESNRHLEGIVADHLGGVEELLVIDLHTGHGPRGEVTHLSRAAPGTPDDRFLRHVFGADAVEATEGNPHATSGPKSGQIAPGVLALADPPWGVCTTIEFGTATDEEQLVATYQEQWVFRRGDRSVPEHAAAVWAYRNCFTPDDPAWEQAAMTLGREHLDAALTALGSAALTPAPDSRSARPGSRIP